MSIGIIRYNKGSYTGTQNDITKEFNLTHKNIPIFQRYFDGEDSSVVNILDNTIKIPNHFYVTGEEIKYSYPSNENYEPIGIGTTFITGIGNTDKLPSLLYVVKVDDLNIRVAASASEALKSNPNILNITSVGVGNSHILTSKNQNKKVIIGIDNFIQSPIVASSTTTILSNNVTPFDSTIYVLDTTSIFSGNLLKIDDELLKVISVGVASTNAIVVSRSLLGSFISTHSSSSQVTKVTGNYNIIGNKIYFSDPPYGEVPIPNQFENNFDEIDYVGIKTSSSFSGRVFLRNAIPDTSQEPYSNNYILDDVSEQFNGHTKTFNLQSNSSNVVGISSDNAILLINGIFQTPNTDIIANDYDLNENIGITSLTFTGLAASTSYDVNTSSIPKGGIIFSVGSFYGSGYQPLVAAGGTAVVSSAGTIQSISIGNSGSGYRVGIQTVVNVGVRSDGLGVSNIEFVGIASINNGHIVNVSISNPGSGYTSTNPPVVIFDSPLPYSNIPLIYSSQYSPGIGTGARIDIVVGQGSSVISFELTNLGYGYKKNEVLTINSNSITGIPTSQDFSFSEFQILIDDVKHDSFSAWTVGNFQVIDSLDSFFDGIKTKFPLLIDGSQTTIRAKKGSNIDIQASLLVFINDVLQVPGKGYIFNGGSIITFTEPPKEGDKSRIVFYRGTADLDTLTVDILESIKVGDEVTIKSDNLSMSQDERLVTNILSSDIVNTNLYSGPGISADENLLRPLTWCKQTADLVINGAFVGKDRVIYEPYIQPTTNIIQNVGVGSTFISVDCVKSFFDSQREYLHNGVNEKPQNKILIISQNLLAQAEVEAVVSLSGTISSVSIINGGVGYITNPIISIGTPIGIGTTGIAKATASIINGSVSSISIVDGGYGYDNSQPPPILVEPPSPNYEIIDKVSYEGDFGIIVGVSSISTIEAPNGLVFDLFIPNNSILRDPKIVKVGVATTGISGITTGFYFTVNKSNIGSGVTSLDSVGNIIGIGTNYIDNLYKAISVSIGQTSVPGVGITNVTKVTVSISNYTNLSGFGFSSFYGEYSWGRILTPIRNSPKEFISYANIGGISTSPIVQRYNRLKYIGYSTT